MQTLHHIWISRMLAGVAFCMFLVLTPRAWVDPGTRPATEEIPIDMLEKPSDCLWCDDPMPAPAECDETKKPRMWLNPDQPLPPLGASPCTDSKPDSSGPSA